MSQHIGLVENGAGAGIDVNGCLTQFCNATLIVAGMWGVKRRTASTRGLQGSDTHPRTGFLTPGSNSLLIMRRHQQGSGRRSCLVVLLDGQDAWTAMWGTMDVRELALRLPLEASLQ